MKRLQHFLFSLLICTAMSQGLPAYCADNNMSFIEKTKNKALDIKKKIKPYLKPENIIIGLIVTAAVVRLCFYLKNNHDNPPPSSGCVPSQSRYNSRIQTHNRRTIAVDTPKNNNTHLPSPAQWTNINTANTISPKPQSAQSNIELEKECFICFESTNNHMACCDNPIHNKCLTKWTTTHPENRGTCPACQTNKDFRVI